MPINVANEGADIDPGECDASNYDDVTRPLPVGSPVPNMVVYSSDVTDGASRDPDDVMEGGFSVYDGPRNVDLYPAPLESDIGECSDFGLIKFYTPLVDIFSRYLYLAAV